MTTDDDDQLLGIPVVRAKRGGIRFGDGSPPPKTYRTRWWRRPRWRLALVMMPWVASGLGLAAVLILLQPPSWVSAGLAMIAVGVCVGVLRYAHAVIEGADRPRLRARMRIRVAAVRHVLRRFRVRWRWYDLYVGVYFGPGEVFVLPFPCLCISYRWGDTRPVVELSWAGPMRVRVAGTRVSDEMVLAEVSSSERSGMTLVLRSRW